MNSLVDDHHSLADIEESCGRLRAVKDTLATTDFVLAARIEASIAGHDQQEALARAHACAGVGVDSLNTILSGRRLAT
jgi:phosphoenolpyruvate phosphomutase